MRDNPPVQHSNTPFLRSLQCHDPHESPAVMTVPLVILAVFAILLGFVGTPAWPWFDGFLNGEPVAIQFQQIDRKRHARPDAGVRGDCVYRSRSWLVALRQTPAEDGGRTRRIIKSRNRSFSGCWRTNISWMKFTRRPSSVSTPGRRGCAIFWTAGFGAGRCCWSPG